jgi:hypothetical protein
LSPRSLSVSSPTTTSTATKPTEPEAHLSPPIASDESKKSSDSAPHFAMMVSRPNYGHEVSISMNSSTFHYSQPKVKPKKKNTRQTLTLPGKSSQNGNSSFSLFTLHFSLVNDLSQGNCRYVRSALVFSISSTPTTLSFTSSPATVTFRRRRPRCTFHFHSTTSGI